MTGKSNAKLRHLILGSSRLKATMASRSLWFRYPTEPFTVAMREGQFPLIHYAIF